MVYLINPGPEHQSLISPAVGFFWKWWERNRDWHALPMFRQIGTQRRPPTRWKRSGDEGTSYICSWFMISFSVGRMDKYVHFCEWQSSPPSLRYSVNFKPLYFSQDSMHATLGISAWMKLRYRLIVLLCIFPVWFSNKTHSLLGDISMWCEYVGKGWHL